ncbi:MAG TPA: L28 family ribosomal protein [Candidatus Pacearchaeota archaeon]|nr:L28 family ribosomal protein [Candidatus Pacearchaeota archaeon]HQI74407.1 L28 family ribosomal protein [Candidatus Pacearchaeota archaeon]
MSRICQVCNKGSIVARKYSKLMSKYNPSPKSRRYPNLQEVYIPKDVISKKFKEFSGKRIKLCTKCLKTLSKPTR